MKYKCIILDHDDTAVDSTRDVHYPAIVETINRLRPDRDIPSREDWLLQNFHPGIMSYLEDDLKLNKEEIEIQYNIWISHVKTRAASFYPGFLDLIREFKALGGRVAVVSHSTREFIERDYNHAGAGDIPEIIYGWDYDENKRKPSAYPVQRILKEFNLNPEDALILDDLKPAVLMGQRSGVHVAAAGWGHQIPEIMEYMRSHSHYYLENLSQLRNILI